MVSGYVAGERARRKQVFCWLIERSATRGFGLVRTRIPRGGWRNNRDDLLLLHTTLWLRKKHSILIHPSYLILPW